MERQEERRERALASATAPKPQLCCVLWRVAAVLEVVLRLRRYRMSRSALGNGASAATAKHPRRPTNDEFINDQGCILLLSHSVPIKRRYEA